MLKTLKIVKTAKNANAEAKLLSLRKNAKVKKDLLVAVYGPKAWLVLLHYEFVAVNGLGEVVLWKKLPNVKKFNQLAEACKVTVEELVEICDERAEAAAFAGELDWLETAETVSLWPNLKERKVFFFDWCDSPFSVLSEALNEYAAEAQQVLSRLADDVINDGDEVAAFEEDEVESEAA